MELHPHDDLLRWYRALVALRRSTPALQDGSLDHVTVEFSERDAWLVLYRQSVAVACNFSNRSVSVILRFPGRLLLSSDQKVTMRENAVDLRGESVAILEQIAEASL